MNGHRKGTGIGVWIAIIVIIAVVFTSGGYYMGLDHGAKSVEVLPAKLKVGALISNVDGAAEALRGMQVAASYINESGGVAGRSIELIIRSTNGNPEKAKSEVESLLKSGVKIFIGALSDSEVEEVAPLIQGGEAVLLLLSENVKGNEQSIDAKNLIFRVAGSLDLEAKAMVKTASTLASDNAAIIAPNDTYGTEMANRIKMYYSSVGGKNASVLLYNPANIDVREGLLQLGKANVSVIFLAAHANDVPEILSEAMSLEVAARWILSSASAEAGLLGNSSLASYINGSYVIAPFVDSSSYDYERFDPLYRALYGGASTTRSAFGYDALMLVSFAIGYGGKYDGPTVKQALFQVGSKFSCLTGQKTFDEQGNALQRFEVWRVARGGVEVAGYWTPQATGLGTITWISTS